MALSPKRPHRWLVRIAVLLGGGVVLLEVGLRFAFGLGSPVLVDRDPEIEYLLRPNQDLVRFGQRITTNAFGMRSRAIGEHRTDPNELRVLVFGDSVVNGGVLTDQDALATTLLETDLAARLARPVFVGNISAGSWGPPNMLAYVERFGWFDADVVIVVLSSTDAGDNSFRGPLNETQLPEHRPLSAISEFVTRYLPRYLPAAAAPPESADADRLDEPASLAACELALETFISRAREHGAKVSLIQHWELPEIEADSPRLGHNLIGAVADRANVPRLELGPMMREGPNGARALFRDHIHPNEDGQRVLARALAEALGAHPPDRRN